MTHEAVGTVGLDNGRAETHGNPLDGFDDDTGETPRLAPTLAASIEVPTSRHAHVRVQNNIVVPHGFEMLSVHIARCDRATHAR